VVVSRENETKKNRGQNDPKNKQAAEDQGEKERIRHWSIQLAATQ
jgi:hypothetical protein